MPYTKESLQSMYSLSLEDVLSTLTACGLAHDREEYSDSDIESRFDVIRQFFTNQQVSDYQQASTLFQQSLEASSNPKSKEKTKKKTQTEVPQLLNITELLIIARDQGLQLTLKQASIILRLCELQDQDEYSQLECERFVETCKSIKQSNKSFEEIALKLDAKEKNETSGQSKIESVIEVVSEKTVEAQEELSTLVNNITATQAEEIPALVQSYYLQNVIDKLQQSDSPSNLFSQLESRILARIEEKKRQRRLSRMTLETNPLQASSPTPMLPPNASENDMSTE